MVVHVAHGDVQQPRGQLRRRAQVCHIQDERVLVPLLAVELDAGAEHAGDGVEGEEPAGHGPVIGEGVDDLAVGGVGVVGVGGQDLEDLGARRGVLESGGDGLCYEKIDIGVSLYLRLLEWRNVKTEIGLIVAIEIN